MYVIQDKHLTSILINWPEMWIWNKQNEVSIWYQMNKGQNHILRHEVKSESKHYKEIWSNKR
jgi:hypothetical protein